MVSGATNLSPIPFIELVNMSARRFSPAAPIDERPEAPPLEAGEGVVDAAEGVLLGWQLRTVLIWWMPGLVFTAIAWLQSRSWIVTIGVLAFCAALFAFYANDREVRPRSRGKRYVLTDRRLLVGAPATPASGWRPVALTDIARTRMEEGLMDRVVARLSGAATIVLELNSLGPKGEPRELRIGPMRNPVGFRRALDERLLAAPR